MADTTHAQETQVLIDLKNTLARQDKAVQRRESAFNYIKKLSPDAIRELFESVAKQSLRWEAENAVFIMFIDQSSIYRRLGKTGYRQYWQRLQTSETLKRILPILADIRELSSEEIVYLQALFNIWLQITINVDDRGVNIGHPQLSTTLMDLLTVLWREKDFNSFRVVLDRDEFPPCLHPMLIKILEELDFESTVSPSLYQLELAESTIEDLASGALIKSQKKAGGDAAAAGKLADAMILRQAEKLLRKIVFSIRSLSMYPTGHPGLKNTFESTLESVMELMENRRMVVVTQLAGSILVNEIRIKAEDRIVLQFVELLEERGISSITFLPSIEAREIEALVKMFNCGISSLNDEGGPRPYLLNNGVEHIILDQYRYGVIGSDEEIVHMSSIGWGGGSESGNGSGTGGSGAGGGFGNGTGFGGSSGFDTGVSDSGGHGIDPGVAVGGDAAIVSGAMVAEHFAGADTIGTTGSGTAQWMGGGGGGGGPGTKTSEKPSGKRTAKNGDSDDDIDFGAVEGVPYSGTGTGTDGSGFGGSGTGTGTGGTGFGGSGHGGTAVVSGHGLPGSGYGGAFAGMKTMPGKSAEILLLHDIVGRVSGGGAITDITNEDVGRLFKRILSGEIDRHQEYRKSLAELIVSLDPDFLQRAIVESPDVRERLSWSVSRKIIEKTLHKLQAEKLDERLVAIEVLHHISELAIVRRKDSSLRLVMNKLIEHLLKSETDLDTCQQLAEIIGSLTSKVIVNGNLKMALDYLNELKRAQDNISLHPARHKLGFRIDALNQALQRVASQESVRYLVRQLGKDKQSIVTRTIKILELLKSEETVVQLMSVFEHGSRRERKTAFNILLSMSDVAGDVITLHLSVLQDREYFPRKHDNVREMVDEAWYRVRNSLGILAKIQHKDALKIFRLAIHDQDYRVRKETIFVLMNAHHSATTDIAKALLKDPEEEVRSLAILAMRDPSGTHAVNDLVQLFMNEPNLRRQILETLAAIEEKNSREFINQCLLLTEPSLKKLYFDNISLQIRAIQCLAEHGGSRELKLLQTFRERNQSFYRRLRSYPFRYAMKSKKVISAVDYAIEQIQQHKLETEQEIPAGDAEDFDEHELTESQVY